MDLKISFIKTYKVIVTSIMMVFYLGCATSEVKVEYSKDPAPISRLPNSVLSAKTPQTNTTSIQPEPLVSAQISEPQTSKSLLELLMGLLWPYLVMILLGALLITIALGKLFKARPKRPSRMKRPLYSNKELELSP